VSDPGIQVVLTPGDLELQDGDWAWVDEFDLLRQELHHREIDAREESVPRPGEKGGTAELILALAGSGAVTGAVAALRNWLDQRQTRTMTITVEGAEPVRLDLRAVGVTDETVRAALVAALERTNPEQSQTDE
jgi:hypothetical protein